MRVTYPHMGYLWVTLNALFRGLGQDIVVPPPCTKKTLSLGTKYSPEFACLPLKVNLGNYLEAIELGADTVIMGGGVGPCRFGYYAQIQQEILKDLGHDIKMVVLEPPDTHFSEVIEKLRYITKNPLNQVLKGIYLAWTKTCVIDRLEEILFKVRPRQIKWGEADKIFSKAIKKIDMSSTKYQVKLIFEETKKQLLNIPQDNEKPIVKIAIVGEIYTVLEPFVNCHIEKQLGKLGVEVERSIFLSHWINENLLGGLLPISLTRRRNEKLARPFLNHFVGGHGRETISSAVKYSKEVDGLIQIAPLTCMPEIVAQSILPEVSEKYSLPVMTLYVDEQTGEAGLLTRLEAFVDMLARKKAESEGMIL